MKSKEYLWVILLIVFLLASNIYTCFRCRKANEMQSFLYELKKKSNIKIERLESANECRTNEIFLNGREISVDLGVTDINGNKRTISDIMSDNTLVLRYSEIHCDVCIDSIIAKLNLYKDFIGLQNIVLLTNAKNLNYTKRFRKVNRICFDIYNVDKALDSVLVDIGMPYLFVYSSGNKRINNMFVPQKEDSRLTDEYLHSILLHYYAK